MRQDLHMTNLGHVVNLLRRGCSGTCLLYYSWISANPRFRGEVLKGGTFICAIRLLSVFTLEVAKFSLILGGIIWCRHLGFLSFLPF